MLLGYARTSTIDQKAGFDTQLVELEHYGCERIFQEQVSAVATRQELERAIDVLREGDKLVVTKLDRLARNVVHMGGQRLVWPLWRECRSFSYAA